MVPAGAIPTAPRSDHQSARYFRLPDLMQRVKGEGNPCGGRPRWASVRPSTPRGGGAVPHRILSKHVGASVLHCGRFWPVGESDRAGGEVPGGQILPLTDRLDAVDDGELL